MIRQTEYFEKPGKDNTNRCVEIVMGLAEEGFSHVVVATTSGGTALRFAKELQSKKVNLVAVTHNAGTRAPIRMNASQRPEWN